MIKITDIKKKNKKISDININNRPADLAPIGGSVIHTAGELFREREYYKDLLFAGFANKEKNLLDSWNSALPYGLLDPSGVPCVPVVENMQEIDYSGGASVFVLNFVADAFDLLAEDMEIKGNWAGQGSFSTKTSLYANPFATAGFESADDAYNEHMVGDLFSYFADSYIKKPENTFKDFSGFIKVYVKYIEKIAHRIPITFSSFVKSPQCSPLSSGLVVDIYSGNANDDLNKFKSYLSDPNYENFRLKAEKRGFFLDKNLPWRLYANLVHPAMRQKMIDSGFIAAGPRGVANLYGQAFKQTYFQDVEYLRFYLVSYYNAIISSEPAVYLPSYKCVRQPGINTSIHMRNKVKCFNSQGAIDENSDYAKKYGPLFWLRMYYNIRSREASANINKKQLDKMHKKFYYLYKIQGFNKTIFAINEEVNKKPNSSKIKRLKMMEKDQPMAKKKNKQILASTAPPATDASGATGY